MYQVDIARCSGCETCVPACPLGAVQVVEGRAQIDPARCNGCGACVEACPNEAIERVAQPAAPGTALPAGGPLQAAPAPIPAGEIITVQIPPPPAITPARLHLARRVAPAFGAALAFLGREVGPRLLRLARDLLDERLSSRSRPGRPRSGGSRAGRGTRYRRRGRS